MWIVWALAFQVLDDLYWQVIFLVVVECVCFERMRSRGIEELKLTAGIIVVDKANALIAWDVILGKYCHFLIEVSLRLIHDRYLSFRLWKVVFGGIW
jgi:hypothetical protein